MLNLGVSMLSPVNLLAVFIVSFLVEFAAAAYTITLTRGKVWLAVFFSVANDLLGWLVVLVVIYNDIELLPAAILGNALGTAVTIKFARRI
jgi:hypothetical protein